jgi:hypothetical protein
VLEIANRTPFPAAIAPSMDKTGLDWANVAVKGTFAIAASVPLPISEAQVPIWEGDQHRADPVLTSIRYASDLGPAKTGTDVALVGHAYAKGGRGSMVDVGLQAGPVRKVLRVYGDRQWLKAALAWVASQPLPFDRIPLIWERAYGGRDESHPDKAKHSFEARNPVGTGYVESGAKEKLEGLALPNLEDINHLITTWKSHPPPVCFGFIGPNWAGRSELTGTYDEAWQKNRLPQLPEDFDERFHNAAIPELVARPHLVGGERVTVAGATPEGHLSFELPKLRLGVTAWIRGKESTRQPVLDTVVIEPDEKRVSLTWRACFPCPRQFAHVEAVLVRFEQRP